MEHTSTHYFSLVCDLLADMLLPHLTRQNRVLRLSEVSEELVACIELEGEEQMNTEMTASLLGTSEYKLIA